ncbi:MAG TPA: N-acetylglucosamine-6-phosphate deacetylase [Spirochaetia bacterium]
MTGDLLLYNGRVLAETQTLPRGYVLSRDGRIASIGVGWESLEEWRDGAVMKIDVGGLAICPGLIDMHTHGIMDVSFMDDDVPAMVRGLSAYARHGVTRLLATTLANPYDVIIAQARRIAVAMEDPQYGAMLHGVHMEGPWLAARCRGGHDLRYLRTPERADVERVLGEAGDVIRTVTYAPELPGAVWLTEQLSWRGIVPVMGHTEATWEQAREAILAGARHVTHLYDATLGFTENPNEALVMMPGMETAALYDDNVSIELIGCPVHVPKPFFPFIDKVKPSGKKVIVTDSLVGAGQPEGTVITYKDGHKVYVEKGVLRMINDDPKINGNLTGSAVTLNVALRRLQEYAGLPLPEAIRWVTLNPATTLGIDHETGSLRVGKLSDIAVLDDECNAHMTFVKGKRVF